MKLKALLDKIDDIFRKFFDEQRLPSLSVGIVHGGQIVHSLQLVSEGHPKVSIHSIYGIASMTKSFVGAAFLILRDRGDIQFHEPVTKFLPFLKRDGRWKKVTVGHLLTMQSGLPEDNAWGDRQLELTDDGYTALFQKSIDEGIIFHAAPGEQIIYSNFGYFLLGRILTVVSGQHALEFISNNFLTPLGMKNSAWTADQLPSELTLNGYGPKGEGITIPRSVGDGAVFGGLLSSGADICTWMNFIMDDSADLHQNILKRESRAELRSGHGVVPIDK